MTDRGIILEFAIEDWRTNCKLQNADYGRVLGLSHDGLGIILKLYWNLQLKDWGTNCRFMNADYGRVLAQSNDGLGIILKFCGISIKICN